MLSWTVAVALAGEPILDGPIEPYPSVLVERTDPTGKWTRADLQGVKATRMGAYLCVGGTALTAGSLGLMALQDEAGPYVAGTGGVLFLFAMPTLIAAPPVILGGSLRSRRALKERGVRVSALPGAFGWTLYAFTPYMLAIPNDQSGAALLSYGGAMALGFYQSHLNAKGRAAARLPDPRGAREPVPRARRLQLGVVPNPKRGVSVVGRF